MKELKSKKEMKRVFGGYRFCGAMFNQYGVVAVGCSVQVHAKVGRANYK